MYILIKDAGRTGTFVAIGMGLHLLESGKALDIPELIKKLRRERAGNVENVEQYLYIYYVFLRFWVDIMTFFLFLIIDMQKVRLKRELD